jgi:hypothetical protein
MDTADVSEDSVSRLALINSIATDLNKAIVTALEMVENDVPSSPIEMAGYLQLGVNTVWAQVNDFGLGAPERGGHGLSETLVDFLSCILAGLMNLHAPISEKSEKREETEGEP